MAAVRRALQVVGLAVSVSLAGCAAAYHDYPCGCVPYAYCPPPPLPFTTYSYCGCPTPIAQQHGLAAEAR